MISKSSLKLIQSLKLKKFRQKYDLFVAEGLKTVTTMLSSEIYNIETLYVTHSYVDQMSSYGVPITIVTDEDLSKASFKKTRADVLAVFHMPSYNDDGDDGLGAMIYLDDVQDPGNVGTIIRIADWYGVKQVIRSHGSADFYAPKVVQSAMGSLAGPQLLTLSQEDWLEIYDPFVVASSLGGVEEFKVSAQKNLALVVGNEGNGASQFLLDRANVKVKIGGASGRMAESLNASVATAILCDRIFTGLKV